MGEKCVKKTQENPKGSIIETEMPIHYSNVMAIASSSADNKEKVDNHE